MNKIIIKELNIRNFKGIAKLDLQFDEQITRILADNGNGKSTIKDAWKWCLCQNVDDVLPWLNHKEIPDLLTSVKIILNINDIEYILERESKGKYVTEKETGIRYKKSNESKYKIDGIEMQQTIYQTKLADIFGAEAFSDLILLTDKEFFNSDTTNWKWTDRRKLLMAMSGAEEKTQELIEKIEYKDIKPYIQKGYPTSNIKSMLKREKSTAKQQQETNMVLIDSKQKELDEYLGIDFDVIGQNLGVAKTKLTKLINSTKKENQTEEMAKINQQIFDLTKKVSTLKTNDELARQKLRDENLRIFKIANDVKTEYEKLQYKCNVIESEIKNCNSEIETICPTCHQEIPKDKIDEAKKIRDNQIKNYTNELEKLKNDKTNALNKYNDLVQQLSEIELDYNEFSINPEINILENQIKDLKITLDKKKISTLNKNIDDEKTQLESQISALEREMAKKEFLTKSYKQIEVWKDENKQLADNIIAIESKEQQLQDFMQEQTDIINKSINDCFSNGISWNLYNENYAGTLDETCVCMYNGKRYSSLSNGEKYITNLEVLKTLQEYFGLNAPIFCDNEESVTIPYSTDRQIIGLYASQPITMKSEKFISIKPVKISDLY